MDIRPPFVIFSAARSEFSDAINATRSQFLQRQLDSHSICYRVAEGVFEGIKERAFIVFTHEGTDTAEIVERLAARYEQKCILYVDAAGLAYLRFMDKGPDEEVGQFRQISAYEASRASAYTVIDGSYYAAG